ncbi:MAG: signal peptide peptidase SppA [wastewater metagenome]|nr:signal peptide peptidase SppA [Candidatus Loosdrechtia aerotolerans]
MKKKKRTFWYTIPVYSILCISLLSSFGCTLISVSLFPPIGPLTETTVAGSGKNKVLLMDISGIITYNEEENGLLSLSGGQGMVSRVREELRKAAKDEYMKAVVLRINSPGGEVTASDAIYHEIEQFKKNTGIGVIACITDLGASGGYYVAVSADKIVAHPTAVTGSIGVIMLNVSVEGLLQKIGIKDTTITTAEHKDMGSPLKTISEEEREIFLSVLNAMHERFVTIISNNRRGLEREKIVSLADGRIYIAEQALENGLVDMIGYLDDAIILAKKEAGIKEARVVIYHRPGVYKSTIHSRLANPGAVNFINIDLKSFVRTGTPSFMYLWSP